MNGRFSLHPSSFIISLSQSSGRLFDAERFDDVADFDVLEALDADAALEALTDFRDVLLEVTQRCDLAFENDAVVAQQSNARRPRNHTLGHHAAGNRARLRNLERVAHFGAAHEDFLQLRIEE